MIPIIKKIVYYLFTLRGKIVLIRKIRLIYNSISSKKLISKGKIEQHINMWAKLGQKPNLMWYKSYASINGDDRPEYITEIDYYNKVELILNNRTFSEAYCDKNFYHKYLDNTILPQIFLRNIQGVYYSSNYETISSEDEIINAIQDFTEQAIIKKTIDSGGGRGIELFNKDESGLRNQKGALLTKRYLERIFVRDFIIQEYIKQNSFFRQFNSSSVNTVRLLTYRSVKTNEVIPLQAVLRIGMPGSLVDNQASGGVSCGINPEGTLNSFIINKKGERFNSFNGINFNQPLKIDKYSEIISLGIELAKKYPYHRLIGFDFCVNDNNEIKLIEINNRNNEINFFQMNNGPLFKEYTYEVIEYCMNGPKTISFDFEI